MRKIFLSLLSLAFVATAQAQKPTTDDVLTIINKVNTKWQSDHSPQTNSFWDNAAYHTGNIEAYKLTGNTDFYNYSLAWAEHNRWQGATGTDRSKWKYNYGETPDHVLFGDWQICFQTYADLYKFSPDTVKIARAREVMEYEMSTNRNDYWWWADGLYMVMPVMTKMYNITRDSLYLEKLYEYWSYANSIMYDEEEGLYYRDAKYTYDKHKTVNGKKDFWARGDGWVLAALAKVIADLPTTDSHRNEYIDRYKTMAKAVASCQQPEGYWTRSMLDLDHAPGRETSGTAFFTYGLLWGLNNGYLDKDTFEPVVMKSWKYLTEAALQADGTIGYVQPIGERAIPGQTVGENSTANFGVGAFLLAACEMYRYVRPAGYADRIRLAESDVYGYLYCHMSRRGEWTAFALSRDGINYHDLYGGEEVYDTKKLSEIEGGARDAYIARAADGKGFVMVTTDMCVKNSKQWYNYGINLLRSDNLIDWQAVTFDFRKGPEIFCDPESPDVYKDYSAINRVWAPQVMWDSQYTWSDGERGGYFIYYSLLNGKEDTYDRIFYSYADRSFTKLTKPRVLIDWGYATIDTDINYVEADGKYHILIKKEGGKPGIFTTSASEIIGPYPEPDEHDFVSFEGNKKCEGPSAFQIAGEKTWRVAYVEYTTRPPRYRVCQADERLHNFHSPTDITGVADPQHGSFIQLTKEEYERLDNNNR